MHAPTRPEPFTLLSSLLLALRWTDDSLQARLKTEGWKPVSFAQSQIMIHVWNGVTRPIELARNLGISRQAIHRTLQEMARDKLIVLQSDPSDKRAKIVAFNAESTELMRAALRALAGIEDDLAQRLGAIRLHQLISTLAEDWGSISTGAE